MIKKAEALPADGDHLPCMMLAAPKSGSGKTIITCGLLYLLKKQGMNPSAFKCGPDFIDPLFHQSVLNVPSRNLDTYFADADTVRHLYQSAVERQKAGIAVIEGVMGYYDGAGMTTAASSYELASVLNVPVILVADAAGMGNSLIPLLKGYLEYRNPSYIEGVLLNKISSRNSYERLKKIIEKELPLKVAGYVPKLAEAEIASRHLGLHRPQEIKNLQERIQKLAEVMEQTADVQMLLEIAGKRRNGRPGGNPAHRHMRALDGTGSVTDRIRLAAAADEAFCFYYQDNLELLEELGAELVFFSPLHDTRLPDSIHGMLLGGGYPELYAKQLSENTAMCKAIREQLSGGLPFLAECGGFLYLKETLEGIPMAGVLSGSAFSSKKLARFGYMELTAQKDTLLGPAGTKIKAHEFHYYDTSENGSAFLAEKPFHGGSWQCMQAGKNYVAGFPHLYFYSNPKAAEAFMKCCIAYKEGSPLKNDMMQKGTGK